ILNGNSLENIQTALTRFILQSKYEFNNSDSKPVNTGSTNGNNSKFNLLSSYLLSSPECYELFKIFEFPNISYHQLAKLLDTFTIIINLNNQTLMNKANNSIINGNLSKF